MTRKVWKGEAVGHTPFQVYKLERKKEREKEANSWVGAVHWLTKISRPILDFLKVLLNLFFPGLDWAFWPRTRLRRSLSRFATMLSITPYISFTRGRLGASLDQYVYNRTGRYLEVRDFLLDTLWSKYDSLIWIFFVQFQSLAPLK